MADCKQINKIIEHLNEFNHVFHDGHMDRLQVSAWDRNTVADGTWININTIKPLSARDVYLAECLDDISASQRVYKAGNHITITQIPNESPIKYKIDLDDDYKPFKYEFTQGFTSAKTDNKVEVSLNINEDDPDKQFLGFDENNALSCNADAIAYYTTTSRNEEYSKTVNELHYNYDYNIQKIDLEVVDLIPTNMELGKVYFIG